jgi:U3 small nucleolar RNA-associated protein 22
MEQYAADSTLVDPMVDDQGDSDDDDSDDEEDSAGDAMDEDEDEAPAAETPAAGPSRSGPSRSLYKAPTLAELDELRNAEASGGNAFSLQLDELLKSTLLPITPAPALKTLLGAIHDLVHALPALPAVTPRKANSRLKAKLGGSIPFPGPKALSPLVGEPKWTLGFDAPAEVVVAGSWSVCGGYKKAKGKAGNVDIVVMMPQVSTVLIPSYYSQNELTLQAMFSAKDRTAYRYFHKRAHYLAVIAAALKTESTKEDSALYGVEIEWEHADARRPIVSIAAGKGTSTPPSFMLTRHSPGPQARC